MIPLLIHPTFLIWRMKECAEVLEDLRRQHKAHKRYTDMMIAAMAKAGNHVVVTRNLKDFELLLPSIYA